MSSQSLDEEALRHLKSADPVVITAIVRDHTDAVLAAALSLGWAHSDAEELVQETFVNFLRSVHHFQGRSAVRTYLIGILYKKSLERRRSKGREQAADPIDEVFEKRFGFGGVWTTFPKGPYEDAINSETAQLITECSANLTEDQRLAFYLKEVDQAETAEICKILAVSPTNLGVILFRARNKLRECLEKKWKGFRGEEND